MRSRFSSSNLHHFSSSGLSRSPKRLTSVPVLSRVPFLSSPQFRGAAVSNFYSPLKLQSKRSKNVQKRRRRFPHDVVRVNATDDDSVGISSFDDWVVDDSVAAYMFSSSSEGEGSDGEIVLSPLSEVDLPPIEVSTDEAVTVTAHRLASIGRGQKRHRIYHGLLINLALIIFLTMVLLLVDWCGWKIVRLPLAPFYLTSPFFMSLILASCAGYICVPLLKTLKFRQILRKEGPARHSRKKKTPKMGGLFFIPAGISVAKFLTGFSSIEVSAAAAATLAFAAIGLLDDVLSFIKQHNSGLSPCFRLLLEAAVGIWFSFWLDATTLTSPYGMKMLVPLPAPLGLVFLGKFYLFLTSFCFVSMGNWVNLTDDLDGLAGGTAALAFIGLSIAVLPICPELAIFGASMAGACVGFLLHNQYKASVFMGNTGSLALGGALASMAACTGMFFPLFISSGFFVLEALSAMMQVLYFKTTKHLRGSGRRLFRMAPFHHHLELCGHKEPMIVAGAYVVSCVLALFAGYVGLMSA
ncbi:phospho-N-acetylmuramoyl-pentapeptide-transferase homolog isoform X1 [Durio zibethinus]|uniref:Phospho-N-acetylmuramoyl-pentapeptide- transferase homolog isoform X1 n=1 Tax=Durio zibethinus TaxID=66656 RepID=A0A6P5X4J3_DURZI|nr:phospho-N-acetylmuramoyl-pentapeptide-transferase homolog isoform X1 [Durio zibethinus]